LIQEVEEDLERQKMEAAWKKYGSWIVLAAALTVVFTGAFTAWHSYTDGKEQGETNGLVNIVLRDNLGRTVEDYKETVKETKKNIIESYHDAVQAAAEAMNLFNLGYLSIELRALNERLFWALCGKMLKLVREMDFIPEELQGLEALLSDTYFCNCSIFQSMPDSWAI
ncbi:hypothetical protein B4Q13_25570, partial [Lacticaseibacillus rhamnosus]